MPAKSQAHKVIIGELPTTSEDQIRQQIDRLRQKSGQRRGRWAGLTMPKFSLWQPSLTILWPVVCMLESSLAKSPRSQEEAAAASQPWLKLAVRSRKNWPKRWRLHAIWFRACFGVCVTV